MATKKIIITYDEESGNIIDKNGHFAGTTTPLNTGLFDPADQFIEATLESKPNKIAALKELKSAGFTPEDIIKLSDAGLIG